ncbi:MAG: triose-phosphate isomerase [Candidatus Nitrosopolaris sp.]
MRLPLIIINFKNYPEIYGQNTIELSKVAKKVANDTNVEIVVAPPQASIAAVSQSVSIPILCQHLDDMPEGATTGFFVPEMAKSFGAIGSLLNHSEHRLEAQSICNLIERLRSLKMTSVVCAKTPDEVANIAKFDPDFIAIEPPELIGSGKSVSKHKPSVITRSVQAKAQYSSSTKLICGAGIMDKIDVSSAAKLGAEGILVASGIVKSSFWTEKIYELASGFKDR